MFAIDPGLLGDKEACISNMIQLIKKVKSSKKLQGGSEIFVPGERGSRATKSCLETGEVEIEEKLMEELQKAAAN